MIPVTPRPLTGHLLYVPKFGQQPFCRQPEKYTMMIGLVVWQTTRQIILIQLLLDLNVCINCIYFAGFDTNFYEQWSSGHQLRGSGGQGWGRIQLMITITVMITCHFNLSITIMITIIRHYNYRLRL